MILKRIVIDGFGRLVRVPAVEFAPGLTILAGDNEAGKSTLAECVIRTLFGYPNQPFNDDLERFKPWAPGAPFRARVAFSLDDGRAFETTRDFADDGRATTRTLDTQEIVDSWSGGRKVSPGADALSLSLEAYRAAAVIRAGQLHQEDRDGFTSLGERLASVVGAAGEEGADAAISALKKFATEDIGSPQSTKTPYALARIAREKAERDREEASKAFHGLRVTIEQRAAAAAEVEQLAASAMKAEYAAKASRLRALQNRAHSVDIAQARLRAAEADLGAASQNGSAVDAVDRSKVSNAQADAAIAAREVARAQAASAAARDAAGAAQVDQLRTVLDECRKQLSAAQSRAAELDAALAAASADEAQQSVDRATLEALEEDDAALDLLESTSRHAQTHAAIARQQQTPSPVVAAVMLLAGVISIIIGFDAQAPVWEYAGGTVAIGGLVLLFAFISAAGKRADRIRSAEETAEEAGEALDRARDALKVRCRALGATDVASVRRLFVARTDAQNIAIEKRACTQTAASRREQQRAIEAQLASFSELHGEHDAARADAAAVDAALATALNELGIPAAPDLASRVEVYRTLRDSAAQSANARIAVEQAKASLAQALGPFDSESLHHEVIGLIEEVADAPVSAPTLSAAVDEAMALAGLEGLNERLADAEIRLSKLDGAFAHANPPDIAELEERVASHRAEEQRLDAAYRAAQRAQRLIADVKVSVHKAYLPLMNEMLGDALNTVTAGKYARAHLGSDFAVRLDSTESGGTVDPDQLSDGTREQVNLSLRVASAQALASSERVPLILDDALAHADQRRAAASLRWLAALGARGIQSILFTQRPDLVALARELDGVAVIDLAGLERS